MINKILDYYRNADYDFRNFAFTVGQSFQHFVADTRYDRQKDDPAQEPQRYVAALIADQREQNDRNHKDNQQETGTAAGVQR